MMAVDVSEDRIEVEPAKRSVAVTPGDRACEPVPSLLDDRPRRNLALLYGGASRPVSPAFARVLRGQEASGEFAGR
jgi:hypothetical protein